MANKGQRRAFLLAALGAVGVIVVSGCGGSGASVSALGLGPSSTNPAGVRPAWAGGLGPGVTILSPTTHPAAGTPGAIDLTIAADDVRGDFLAECGLSEPSVQAVCKQYNAGKTHVRSAVHTSNLANGYVAIKGDEALVGETGTYCNDNETPPCETNTDPAAVLNSGQSFDALYTQAANAEGSGNSMTYTLDPFIRENGTWYFYTPPSDFTSGG